MDDLPVNPDLEPKPQPTQAVANSPQQNLKHHYLSLKKTSSKLIVAAIAFLVLFLLLILLLGGLSNEPKESSNKAEEQKIATTTSKATVSAVPLTPEEKLQEIYDDIVGTEDVKKTLLIDSLGIAKVEYTIPSADGPTIIKTSYENFADFAVKVFNIEGVTALYVTTYANRFTDKFGQPDQPALKLQVSKTTSDTINWPLKKFVYKDYAAILDFHELNTLLQKDYEKLLKSNSSN